MSHPVGTVVRLLLPCLDNPVGTLGVCYERYDHGDDTEGSSFIFANGKYDGFNEDEQDLILSFVRHDPLNYVFTNVLQLERDFRAGMFANHLR